MHQKNVCSSTALQCCSSTSSEFPDANANERRTRTTRLARFSSLTHDCKRRARSDFRRTIARCSRRLNAKSRDDEMKAHCAAGVPLIDSPSVNSDVSRKCDFSGGEDHHF